MKLLDPRTSAAQIERSRAPALTSLEGKRIGILSNGKLNADNLLLETARVLQQKYGGDINKIVYKRNPSAPAPGETLTNLNPECDYLLTATGD